MHAKISYKIFKYNEKTAVVFIPMETVRFSKITRKAAETTGPSEPVIVKPGRDVRPSALSRVEKKEIRSSPMRTEAGSETQNSQAAAPGSQNKTAISGDAAAAGAFASGFRLTYPLGAQLNLAKPEEGPLDAFLRSNPYQARPDINFFKYLHPEVTSSASSGGGKPRPGTRGGGGQSRGAGVSLNVVHYDLTPWANAVMSKIQKNWSMGQDGITAGKGEVGIWVMIMKSGEVLTLEIASASKIELLDKSALSALQLSAPFPPLPEDFPNTSLEMYFVFQYGY